MFASVSDWLTNNRYVGTAILHPIRSVVSTRFSGCSSAIQSFAQHKNIAMAHKMASLKHEYNNRDNLGDYNNRDNLGDYMGTYDTIGGTPRHDPAFDYDPPDICLECEIDPEDCPGEAACPKLKETT